jgi:hypothetical protein
VLAILVVLGPVVLGFVAGEALALMPHSRAAKN